jgi:hypothetical protein
MIKTTLATGALFTTPIAWLQKAYAESRLREPLIIIVDGLDSVGGLTVGALAAIRSALPIVRIANNQAPDLKAISKIFQERHGSRAIGFMENGMYAVFQELAREAGVRLASLGRHVWNADMPCKSQHRILSASNKSCMGLAIASHLVRTQERFYITETILDAGQPAPAPNGSKIRVNRLDKQTHIYEPVLERSTSFAPSKSGTVPHVAALLCHAVMQTALGADLPWLASDTEAISNPDLSRDRQCRSGSSVTFIMDI